MADAILKNTFQNSLAGYKLVADYTVSGSAITSYDFTGLNITKEDDYMLVSYSYAGYIYVNGNYTGSNYYRQRVSVFGTSISSSAGNNSYYMFGPSAISFIKLKLNNAGYFEYYSTSTRAFGTSGLEMDNTIGHSLFTLSSITSIRISAETTNGMFIGSRFQLYKRVAPIVFDYTVSGSAITSLDITGLSIDKGSEYMLTSTIINPIGSDVDYYLTYNGNNTSTNYYAQSFYSSDTTTSAGRQNTPIFTTARASGRLYTISNIKLTNNGYITSQNILDRWYLATYIEMMNYYSTSTFTSTNITNIKISANSSNAIGAGSRFQLIKLK